MQDLLSRAQNYINYEEKMLGERAKKPKPYPEKRKKLEKREDVED
jgi:hypothetical protein